MSITISPHMLHVQQKYFMLSKVAIPQMLSLCLHQIKEQAPLSLAETIETLAPVTLTSP